MYKGFNLEMDRCFLPLSDFIAYKIKRKKQSPKLDFTSILKKGTLDGNEIIKDWFPNEIKYHIFLSHSHKDEELALEIAYILEERHNLKVFVDSDIWGNSLDLLKRINDKYCIAEKDKTLYDYDKCNYSASHVYLMLINSLNIMIDRCEALFFLNTPNSILLKDSLNNLDDLERTSSPWIFSEIQISKTIRKKIDRPRTKFFSSTEKLDESLQISYPLDIKSFPKISCEIFKDWIKMKYNSPYEALDHLYKSIH